jgi:hypothetical protein
MKKLNLLTYILALFLVVSSCEEPGTSTIFSESFVELDAATAASSRRVYTYLRLNDGNNKPSGFKLNLASAPLSTDVSVTFEIVAASTTAIANVHYVVNSTTVTIPAGQNIVELPISIVADAIEAGETFDIVVNIVSSTVTVQPNLARATHRIQISCPRNIPEGGTWTGTTTGDSFAVAGTNNAVVIAVDGSATGTGYTISDPTAGFYRNFGGTLAYAGRFTNVCDRVILGTTAIGEFGTTVSTSAAAGFPAGTFNSATVTITIPWYDPGNDFGEVTTLTKN